MKQIIITLAFTFIVSCNDQVHDLQVGEYQLEWYLDGEKMIYTGDEWNNYQGLISDDTLRLTTSDIEYFGVSRSIPSHCAGDTMTYDWFQILVPLKVKHKKLIWSNKQIITRRMIYDDEYNYVGTIDTCIRKSNSIVYSFIVRENVIEFVECPDSNIDCKPHEGTVFHLVRPKK